jgi:hypothetical protein
MELIQDETKMRALQEVYIPSRYFEFEDGSWQYIRAGKKHREDGPATYDARDGTTCWYIMGKLHREDGPAIVFGNGMKYYYLNGKQVNKSDLPM